MTNPLAQTWRWLQSIVRRDALERGLDEELQFHIDQQTEKNVRDGMTPGEARRRAVLRFGGVARAQEETRDQIRPALLDDSIRDINVDHLRSNIFTPKSSTGRKQDCIITRCLEGVNRVLDI